MLNVFLPVFLPIRPKTAMTEAMCRAGRSLLPAALVLLFAAGCDSGSGETPETLTVGLNLEISGTLAEVGEQSLRAATMFADETNAAGGVTVGGETYRLALVASDNGGTAQGGTATATRLITEEGVLAMVGPNPSNVAIPAGQVADDLETVMISPWSTNPATTLDRPWVFRVPFLDTFQGPVLARFATEQFGAARACVLYDEASDYPRGLAESFREAWEGLHGAAAVAAYEAFTTGATDFTAPLTRIRDAGCDVVFVPQYPHEVPPIVAQAQTVGVDAPILGADAWGDPSLLEACGAACEGLFFSAHYVAAGATGATRDFIDRYQARYGVVPGDVAALTWDALRLVVQAARNCGALTGDLTADRACIRAGMASIEAFDGITGTMTYDAQGDPIKCAVMVRIENGAFTAFKQACP